MTIKSKSGCVACGTHNEKNALYCTACGNYLPHNYFEMLGIERTANVADIRNAYIKQAVDCRPEKTRHLSPELQELAASKLQPLNLIWDTLRDEQKRLDYIADLEREEHIADAGNRRALEALLWRRGCARHIDYILFAALLSTPFKSFYPSMFEWPSQAAALTDYLPLVAILFSFALLTVLAWVPLEAILLATLGTTPGKWLYRLQVVDANQNKLPFKIALTRALKVWSVGMGWGALIIAPVLNVMWHGRVKQGKLTAWDAQCKSTIIEQPVSAFRLAASSVIVLQSLSLTYFMLGPLPNGEDVAYAHSSNVVESENTVPTLLDSVAASAPLSTTQASQTIPNALADIKSDDAETDTSEVALMAPELTGQGSVENSTTALMPSNSAVNTASKVETTAVPTLVLPPSMRAKPMSALSTEEDDSNRLTTNTKPPLQTAAQGNTSSARRLSQEQWLSCTQRYYDTMSEAQEMPLGDYARINREAMRERERCLSGS
ncbi:MAG: RDD family protein [Gammaproteobacteria bacterium]